MRLKWLENKHCDLKKTSVEKESEREKTLVLRTISGVCINIPNHS